MGKALLGAHSWNIMLQTGVYSSISFINIFTQYLYTYVFHKLSHLSYCMNWFNNGIVAELFRFKVSPLKFPLYCHRLEIRYRLSKIRVKRLFIDWSRSCHDLKTIKNTENNRTDLLYWLPQATNASNVITPILYIMTSQAGQQWRSLFYVKWRSLLKIHVLWQNRTRCHNI